MGGSVGSAGGVGSGSVAVVARQRWQPAWRELPTESNGGGGVVVHCLMGISGRLGGIFPLAEELSTTKKMKKIKNKSY